MMKFAILCIALLLLYGCLGAEGKDCGRDKECLKFSFEKCEKAKGIWEGQNGDIGVEIKGKEGDFCSVSVSVKEEGLGVTNKSMGCGISNASEFSIEENCSGELKGYFS